MLDSNDCIAIVRRVFGDAAPTQRKPLTDEEIIEHFEAEVDTGLLSSFADGVRFAERAHGIKAEDLDQSSFEASSAGVGL